MDRRFPPMQGVNDDRLYFRQLLSGRDFAANDQLAQQMLNYAYLIGDKVTRECVIVDPAYSVAELLYTAWQDGMKVVGALATHYHPDHIGGPMGHSTIEGVKELLELQGMKIHVNEAEARGVMSLSGASASDLSLHEGGDVLVVGEVEIQLVHTPGHTPGSQCFLVDGLLVAGDTLFLEGCGRTDLPGSDPGQMYDSLAVLASLPDDTIVFPGHRYHPLCGRGTLAAIKDVNYVFKPKSKEAWLTMFGQ